MPTTAASFTSQICDDLYRVIVRIEQNLLQWKIEMKRLPYPVPQAESLSLSLWSNACFYFFIVEQSGNWVLITKGSSSPQRILWLFPGQYSVVFVLFCFGGGSTATSIFYNRFFQLLLPTFMFKNLRWIMDFQLNIVFLQANKSWCYRKATDCTQYNLTTLLWNSRSLA